MKIFIAILLILFSMEAHSREGKVVIVELDSKSIKVEGDVVHNLLESLNSLPKCDSVHLIVDRNIEHSVITDTMQTIKKSKCKNISIQSV